MRAPGLNLAGWWARILRGTTGGEPPMVRAEVLPTLIVGDHSRTVPPIQGPVGFGGFSVLGAPANFSWAQLTCYAKGGLWLRSFHVHTFDAAVADSYSTVFLMNVGPSDTPSTNPVSHHLTPGRPVLSKINFATGGVPTIPEFAEAPRFQGGVAFLPAPASGHQVQGAHHWNLWVAPGFSVLIAPAVVQAGIEGFFLFEEIESGGDDQ